MARTTNQCVEEVIGRLGLQLALVQQQLEASTENAEHLTAELAKMKAEKKPE